MSSIPHVGQMSSHTTIIASTLRPRPPWPPGWKVSRPPAGTCPELSIYPFRRSAVIGKAIMYGSGDTVGRKNKEDLGALSVSREGTLSGGGSLLFKLHSSVRLYNWDVITIKKHATKCKINGTTHQTRTYALPWLYEHLNSETEPHAYNGPACIVPRLPNCSHGL